ncbi:MAG: type I restriction endonuclease subunit S, partial [Cyanobacteria bacterium J06614_10]
PLPIPSSPEQKEICKRVEVAFSLIESLNNTYQSILDNISQVNQSILAKAFRGDLVPQDPTDEPAHILLDRIRTEREKTQKAKKKTKRKKKS